MQQPNIYQGPMHELHKKGYHQRMTGNPTTEALNQCYPNCSPCAVCGNMNQLYVELQSCVEIFMYIIFQCIWERKF